jgi:hypothetical protein
MKIKLSEVAAIIPPNTVVPTETRPAFPAPVANTRGTTPRMNASDVIKIGRNQNRAALAPRSQFPKASKRDTERITVFGRGLSGQVHVQTAGLLLKLQFAGAAKQVS